MDNSNLLKSSSGLSEQILPQRRILDYSVISNWIDVPRVSNFVKNYNPTNAFIEIRKEFVKKWFVEGSNIYDSSSVILKVNL